MSELTDSDIQVLYDDAINEANHQERYYSINVTFLIGIIDRLRDVERRLSTPVELPSVPREGYKPGYLAGVSDYYEKTKLYLIDAGFTVKGE